MGKTGARRQQTIARCRDPEAMIQSILASKKTTWNDSIDSVLTKLSKVMSWVATAFAVPQLVEWAQDADATVGRDPWSSPIAFTAANSQVKAETQSTHTMQHQIIHVIPRPCASTKGSQHWKQRWQSISKWSQGDQAMHKYKNETKRTWNVSNNYERLGWEMREWPLTYNMCVCCFEHQKSCFRIMYKGSQTVPSVAVSTNHGCWFANTCWMFKVISQDFVRCSFQNQGLMMFSPIFAYRMFKVVQRIRRVRVWSVLAIAFTSSCTAWVPGILQGRNHWWNYDETVYVWELSSWFIALELCDASCN